MEDIGEELLNFPLRLMKWCGQNPQQNKFMLFTVVAMYATLATTNLGLVFLQLFYMRENKLTVVVQSCEAFMALGQCMFKSVTVAFKINSFRQIIVGTKQFWKTNRFEDNVRNELESIFERTLQMEKIFSRIVLSTAVIVIANFYITTDLPVGPWIMTDHSALFKYLVITQAIMLPYVALHMAANESFFLSICVHLMVQFKMLRYSLENLNTPVSDNKTDNEDYLKKLICYIRHHKFLLRFSKHFKDAYSPIMFVEYTTIAVGCFVEMYIAFESDSIFILLKNIGTVCTALLQLSIYCVPLNYITDEATSVAQGIFESGWNLKHASSLKTLISFVIQRSQQEITFTAGGLVTMNCRTVINVFRISYSFCTVLRALGSHD